MKNCALVYADDNNFTQKMKKSRGSVRVVSEEAHIIPCIATALPGTVSRVSSMKIAEHEEIHPQQTSKSTIENGMSRDRMKVEFWKCLRPILVPMKLFGAWPYSTKGNFNRRHRCNVICTTSAVVLLVFLMFSILGYCSLLLLLQDYGTVVHNAAYLALVLESSVNLLNLLRCRRKIQHCMSEWEGYLYSYKHALKKVSKNTKFVAVIMLTLILYKCTFMLISSFAKGEELVELLPPDVKIVLIVASIIITLIVLAVCFTSSAGPLWLSVVFVATLWKEFGAIGKEMSDTGRLKENIGKYRLHFQKLCQLGCAIDDVFGPTVAVFFMTNIFTAMLLLYMITSRSYYSYGLYDVTFNLAFLVAAIMTLLAVSEICNLMKERVS